MALTQGQKAIVTRAQSLGAGGQAVALSDEACAYLCGVIVRDLGLQDRFPEVPATLPEFFSPSPLSRLELAGAAFQEMFERLVGLDADSDVYFACLAALHKARLKYERILETQAVPTIDQVGPRGLLQYGGMSPKTLAGFLLWRKWIFDIDNRAGQETGYLFEPIIAAAVGGVPASAKRSPIKRRKDGKKGRGRIPDFPVTRSHPPASWPSAANSSICRTYRKTAGEESRRRSPVANRWMRP